MATEKSAFDVSLKASLAKVGLPGQQRDVVQWLLTRFIMEVSVIAVLNQVPTQRSKLLQARQQELLAELNDVADTETPAPTPSTTLSQSPAGPATA